jgi:hypothetical protein
MLLDKLASIKRKAEAQFDKTVPGLEEKAEPVDRVF